MLSSRLSIHGMALPVVAVVVVVVDVAVVVVVVVVGAAKPLR